VQVQAAAGNIATIPQQQPMMGHSVPLPLQLHLLGTSSISLVQGLGILTALQQLQRVKR
jgi:hypothetical protein